MGLAAAACDTASRTPGSAAMITAWTVSDAATA
jgi:hypothetical protein